MKLKKSLAIILSVVMLLSCMAVSTISASAVETNIDSNEQAELIDLLYTIVKFDEVEETDEVDSVLLETFTEDEELVIDENSEVEASSTSVELYIGQTHTVQTLVKSEEEAYPSAYTVSESGAVTSTYDGVISNVQISLQDYIIDEETEETCTTLAISYDAIAVGTTTLVFTYYYTFDSATWLQGAITIDVTVSECTHEYTSEVTTEAVTGESDGETTYTCSICGDTYTEVLHAWGEWTIDAEATCSSTGSMSRSCTVCTFTQESEKISAFDCVYENGYCKWCNTAEATSDSSASDSTTTTTTETTTGSGSNVDVSYEQGITHVYRVEVVWGSLEFNYKDADSVWNVETMTWETDTTQEGSWSYEEDSNVITITNKSSGDVTATISCDSVYEGISISADEDEITVYSAGNEDIDPELNEHVETVYITVSGYNADFTSTDLTKIGSVTIKLSAVS